MYGLPAPSGFRSGVWFWRSGCFGINDQCGCDTRVRFVLLGPKLRQFTEISSSTSGNDWGDVLRRCLVAVWKHETDKVVHVLEQASYFLSCVGLLFLISSLSFRPTGFPRILYLSAFSSSSSFSQYTPRRSTPSCLHTESFSPVPDEPLNR